MFLLTHVVGRSHDMSVKRHVKGHKSRVTFPSTRSQAEYMKYFNALIEMTVIAQITQCLKERIGGTYVYIFPTWPCNTRVFCYCCFPQGSLQKLEHVRKNKWWEEKFSNSVRSTIDKLWNFAWLAWTQGRISSTSLGSQKVLPCNCNECFFVCMASLTLSCRMVYFWYIL